MHPTPITRELETDDLAMLHRLHASLHACLVLMTIKELRHLHSTGDWRETEFAKFLINVVPYF